LFVYCANLAKKLQLPNLFVLKSNNLDEITSCIRIKCLSLQKIAASQQYESKHSFAPAETYDENLLKTIQNK
jgi:hypothetical protein